jgi:prophage antirepressor-like protein
MTEEIKEDNNCIIKAFENNPIAIITEDIDNKQIFCFKASDIGKALNLTNIAVSIQHYDDDEKVLRKAYDVRGCEQYTIFLTSQGVYRLLYNSKKPEAKKFRKWAGNILDDIIFNESKELKRQIEEQKQLLIEQFEKSIFEKHNLLLTRYALSGSLVYFIKVKSYDNGDFIVRIGCSSIGLEPRFKKHKSSYDEAIVLDCFKVDKHVEFESYIHKFMHKSLVKDLVGHENEKEIFLIKSDQEYNDLINVVKNNIKRFNHTDYVEIADLQKEINKLQNKDTKSEEQLDQKSLNQIIENQNKLLKQFELLSNNQSKLENTLITLVKNSNTRTPQEYNTVIKPLQGPKVVQINSETLKIHKVYDTIIELLNIDPHINRNSLKRSIEKKSIYRNYRWMFINRDENIKMLDIQPTNIYEEIKCVGYIAKLNPDKTEIINVYISMQEAVKTNGKIPRNSQCYILYEQCDNILKENFEKINGKPLLYQNGVGQFDNTDKLIKDFASKEDCYRKVNISRALLNKLIKENIGKNGFIYKYIGKKGAML